MEIKKEQIKKLSNGLFGCPEAQNAIRNAFPEAFDDNWIDVTQTLKFRPFRASSFYWIGIYQEGIALQIGWLDSAGAHICTHAEEDYKIEEQKTRRVTVCGDDYFRILRRQ